MHLRHSTKQWLCTLVPTMKEQKRIGCSLGILVLSFLSLQESLRKRTVVFGWSLSQVWFFCDSMDCGPPGSPIHGISPREWIAIYFSKGSSWPKDQTQVSCLAGEFFTTEPPGKPEKKNRAHHKSFLSNRTMAFFLMDTSWYSQLWFKCFLSHYVIVN